MPRGRGSRKEVEPEKPIEPENPVEPEEQVDLDVDNDAKEQMEEEVEYEEVGEEVEEEEEEEEEEVEEANGVDELASPDGEQDMKTSNIDDEESRKHAELLALPPHGSEVYVGGIPHDASEEDLKGFCEAVGEVTEVRMMKGKDSRETFRTKNLAAKAIKDLNSTEFQISTTRKVEKKGEVEKLFLNEVHENYC
ncbi:Heterogeneous nuclear ribonucleoprotein like [Thalictrum thalictroides]|uniref:Heterogeneous nuclear ribonucleoprotein like n=1 Tax=Thalictrum thalictroides TaxID=46969 RepID=A0A7J6WGF1_THATH|nr:Heterogeneous nuclear ribonucleoprotein like [Thalictrum thalictroides]